MTKRKPLEWVNASAPGIGVDGKLPSCGPCIDLLFSPFMVEAVYSVSIETGGNPADMGRRVVESYHANRHQEPG